MLLLLNFAFGSIPVFSNLRVDCLFVGRNLALSDFFEIVQVGWQQFRVLSERHHEQEVIGIALELLLTLFLAHLCEVSAKTLEF